MIYSTMVGVGYRQWLAYGHPYAKMQSLAYGQHVSKSFGRKVQWAGIMLNDVCIRDAFN